jgi:hypothetical protein
MPIVSRAQQAAMFAAKAGKSTLGIPQSVGADFVAAGPAGGSFAKLPQKKKQAGPKMTKALADGRISARAMAKRGYSTE